MLRRCAFLRPRIFQLVDDVEYSRIGTCRKKVMGLLRLMGNKADVVKGLSKRCNENWAVAPKSDIVRSLTRSIVHSWLK